MKTKVLTLLSLILGLYTANAQCTQSVTGFGNNSSVPSYNISGSVSVSIDNTNEMVTLQLGDDFKTAAGPDVRAYWVNPENFTDNQLKTANIANLKNIPFGIVASSNISPNGAKTFTVAIPQNINVGQYTKVFFYCEAFNVFWDFGTALGFTPNTCASLSSPDFNFNDQLTLYPNPVQDRLYITSNNKAIIQSLAIYNLQGQLIQSVPQVTKNSFDVSNLSKGIYIVKVKTDKGNTATKIVKE